MRYGKAANDQVAEVARRRLELLSAELAGIRQALPTDETALADAGPKARAVPPAVSEDEPRGVPVGTDLVSDPKTELQTATAGKHAYRSIGLAGRFTGWVHDRLPPTLQGSVGLTSAHLSIVTLLVAAAMGVTAWWVLSTERPGEVVPAALQTESPGGPQSSPPPLVELSEGVPAQASTGVPATEAPTSAATVPSQGTQSSIIIDVAGKVRRPGIATLPAGSRVADALRRAGGPRRGVDLTALNLARVLVDGEQILVGLPAPTGVAAPAASAPTVGSTVSPGPLVDINTADQVQLETLPNVGPVTAQAILTWRTENGAFTSVDELLEVSGIGDAILTR